MEWSTGHHIGTATVASQLSCQLNYLTKPCLIDQTIYALHGDRHGDEVKAAGNNSILLFYYSIDQWNTVLVRTSLDMTK